MRFHKLRTRLGGVIAFPVTPFKPDLSLDFSALKRKPCLGPDPVLSRRALVPLAEAIPAVRCTTLQPAQKPSPPANVPSLPNHLYRALSKALYGHYRQLTLPVLFSYRDQRNKTHAEPNRTIFLMVPMGAFSRIKFKRALQGTKASVALSVFCPSLLRFFRPVSISMKILGPP
jgi:hypothetical protein